MPSRPLFDLVAVVDFSAASSPGPVRPAKDRCWAAISIGGDTRPPAYFRSRADLIDSLAGAVSGTPGHALIAWDFPFGYPAGSGLGGGRTAVRTMAGLVSDGPRDRNNRFEAAAALNARIASPPGPFWGRPPGLTDSPITEKKPPFAHHPFAEWRIVERLARGAGMNGIQSVWKLYTTGSVGGQAIVGLATLARLNRRLAGRTVRYWPFDTGWAAKLDGVVHVECWPSLFPFGHIDHPIRDARQVAATLDVLENVNARGRWSDILGPPHGLTAGERRVAETEEGWIAGFRTGAPSA